MGHLRPTHVMIPARVMELIGTKRPRSADADHHEDLRCTYMHCWHKPQQRDAAFSIPLPEFAMTGQIASGFYW